MCKLNSLCTLHLVSYSLERNDGYIQIKTKLLWQLSTLTDEFTSIHQKQNLAQKSCEYHRTTYMLDIIKCNNYVL